jgi:hypothetical protein
VKRPEKYKKYKFKTAYLFHCPFSGKTLIKSKQIHLAIQYVFLIGKASEHEPVVVGSNFLKAAKRQA